MCGGDDGGVWGLWMVVDCGGGGGSWVLVWWWWWRAVVVVECVLLWSVLVGVVDGGEVWWSVVECGRGGVWSW